MRLYVSLYIRIKFVKIWNTSRKSAIIKTLKVFQNNHISSQCREWHSVQNSHLYTRLPKAWDSKAILILHLLQVTATGVPSTSPNLIHWRRSIKCHGKLLPARHGDRETWKKLAIVKQRNTWCAFLVPTAVTHSCWSFLDHQHCSVRSVCMLCWNLLHRRQWGHALSQHVRGGFPRMWRWTELRPLEGSPAGHLSSTAWNFPITPANSVTCNYKFIKPRSRFHTIRKYCAARQSFYASKLSERLFEHFTGAQVDLLRVYVCVFAKNILMHLLI